MILFSWGFFLYNNLYKGLGGRVIISLLCIFHFVVDCLLPKDAGPCEAAISKYYYDTKARRCKHFLYGGCQGNRNNFNTLRKCEKKCSTQPGGNV